MQKFCLYLSQHETDSAPRYSSLGVQVVQVVHDKLSWGVEVRQVEFIWHVPSQGSKLSSLLLSDREEWSSNAFDMFIVHASKKSLSLPERQCAEMPLSREGWASWGGLSSLGCLGWRRRRFFSSWLWSPGAVRWWTWGTSEGVRWGSPCWPQ